MKRFMLFAIFLTGMLAVLTAPASAQDNNGGDSASALQEDLNSAIGSLTNRIANVEKKEAMQIEIHGFAEEDVDYDTMTTGKNEYLPNIGLPRSGEANATAQMQQSMRNSRIDFLAKTNVDGWITKGYLEGDFLGASNTSEANLYVAPTFRIRHAYLDIQKDGWDIMAGQYWTLFGWNMDYVLASVQPQPIMGTMYERTPRLGVMKTMGDDAQVQIAVDAERPEQSISAYPNVDAGIRFVLNDWKGDFSYATGASKKVPLSIGISGTFRSYNVGNLNVGGTAGTTEAYGNNDYIQGKGIAVDAMIPIVPASDTDSPSLTASCEWMYGNGVADELNSFSGGVTTPYSLPSGITLADSGIMGEYTAGGAHISPAFGLIDTESYNAQIQIHLPKSIGTFFTFGYGEVFSDNIGTFLAYSAANAYNNDTNIFGNVMQDVTDNVRVAFEVDLATTHYLNTVANQSQSPQDTRLALGTWYRF